MKTISITLLIVIAAYFMPRFVKVASNPKSKTSPQRTLEYLFRYNVIHEQGRNYKQTHITTLNSQTPSDLVLQSPFPLAGVIYLALFNC